MPDQKISQLPDTDALDGSEVAPVVQDGETRKIPVGLANGLAVLDPAGIIPTGQLPTATTTEQGIVELATSLETQTGTDATRAVTPLSAAATYQTPGQAAALYIPLTQKAAANGVATLDAGSDVPRAQRPDLDKVNVRDYGATGDGTTNDSAAITAALAVCADGGVLFFPAGVYYTGTTTWVIDKSITLEGVGGGTRYSDPFGNANWNTTGVATGSVLKSAATSGAFIEFFKSAVTLEPHVRNMVFLGPGTGTSVGVSVGRNAGGCVRGQWDQTFFLNWATGVKFDFAEDFTIRQPTTIGCSTGIHFVNNSNQNVIYGIYVVSSSVRALWIESSDLVTVYGGVLQGNTGKAAYIQGSNGCRIYDIYFENTAGTGAVLVDAVSYSASDYNGIIGCHFGTAADTIDIQTAHCIVQRLQVSQAITLGASAHNCALEGTFNGSIAVSGNAASLMGTFNAAITLDGSEHILQGKFSSTVGGTASESWLQGRFSSAPSISGPNNTIFDRSSNIFKFGSKDLRITTGQKIYLETTGTGSYITRDNGTGDTVVGTATGVVRTDSGTSLFRTGATTTAGRRTASSAGAGAMGYDTTLSIPIFSDGTNWRNAAGTIV